MSASTNRANLINKLFKIAKKHFDAIKPPADRPVLEHMLYACCLEDSDYEAADEVFARLQQEFFDWNEVRVTTINELAEKMKKLYDPTAAALRLRRTMHGMFESHYQFDMDFLKKENLGKAMQTMEKYRGITPFVVAFTAQAGLAGHAIPVDNALLNLLYIIGAITEAELEKRKIPGLARIIPKAKGVEFSSVVHQLAVAFHKTPFNKTTRDIILKIAPDAKERFPKRGAKRKVEEIEDQKAAIKAEKAAKAAAERAARAPKKAAKKAAESAKAAKAKAKAAKAAKAAKVKAAKAKTAKANKATKAKTTKSKPTKKTAKKKVAKKKTTKKKSPAKTTKPTKKKAKTAKASKSSKSKPKKKSPTKRLARKKPR